MVLSCLRQPTGGHTIDAVAADVRLMHTVAMARRKLRFQNGALALNGVKLAFQLESDGQTPSICAPYPIRDSNRLIEEYMLLANFLVAQRLLTHTGKMNTLKVQNDFFFSFIFFHSFVSYRWPCYFETGKS